MRNVFCHCVEDYFGVPAEHFAKNTVGAVTPSGEGKGAEEHDLVSAPAEFFERIFGDALRTDRVRA